MFKSIVTDLINSATALSTNVAKSTTYPDRDISLHLSCLKNNSCETISKIFSDGFKRVTGKNAERLDCEDLDISTILNNADKDGYTLSIVSTSSLISTANEYDEILDQVSIIGKFATTPNVLITSNSFPAKDYKGFESELNRAHGKYNLATYSKGTSTEILARKFKNEAKLDFIHIPYANPQEALADVSLNRIDSLLINYITAKKDIEENKVRVIASTGSERSFQNVPTLNEFGYSSSNKNIDFYIIGPKDTPRNVIHKVDRILSKISTDSTTIGNLKAIGARANYSNHEDTIKSIQKELKFYFEMREEQM